MKAKLIEFPEEILDALAEYKKQTGVSASDFIRIATCRSMIVQEIIKLKIISIDVSGKGNGSSKKIDEAEANELNKFCDGSNCEFNPELIEKC